MINISHLIILKTIFAFNFSSVFPPPAVPWSWRQGLSNCSVTSVHGNCILKLIFINDLTFLQKSHLNQFHRKCKFLLLHFFNSLQSKHAMNNDYETTVWWWRLYKPLLDKHKHCKLLRAHGAGIKWRLEDHIQRLLISKTKLLRCFVIWQQSVTICISTNHLRLDSGHHEPFGVCSWWSITMNVYKYIYIYIYIYIYQ